MFTMHLLQATSVVVEIAMTFDGRGVYSVNGQRERIGVFFDTLDGAGRHAISTDLKI